MKPRTVLICLFLLATVLVDVVVMSIASRRAGPHWVPFVSFALLMSQMSLVAIWLALGKTPAPVRLIGAVLVAGLWTWADLPGLGNAVLMLQLLAVSLPLLAFRSSGAGLADVSVQDEAEDGEPDPRRFQFSILYLLGWTTALAVMLGTSKYLLVPGELMRLVEHANQLVFWVVGRVATAMCALWASFGTRWMVLRILSLPVVAGAAFALRMPVPERYWFFGKAFSLEVVLLVGSLLVFRMAGYRFRWRKRRAQKTATGASDSNASVDGSGTGVTDE